MNNKTFKRVVALVATVMMLCSCAFAATVGEVTYDQTTGEITVPFTAGEGATKALLFVYDSNGNIVAANQINDLAGATEGTFSEKIDTAKLANAVSLTAKVGDDVTADANLGAKTVKLQYTVTIDGVTAEPIKADAGSTIATLLESVNTDKAATPEFTYEFVGWYTDASFADDKALDPAATLMADTTVYAKYNETKNKYTVTWDIDGATTTEEVEYGTVPTAPENPTKNGDAQYSYTFTGWDKDIVEVTGDVTYTAVFEPTVNKYTVTWVVEGEETTAEYEYGQTPVFDGTPTKTEDAENTYTFAGWTPTIATVTGDATYTAEFTANKKTKYYTITLTVDGEDYKVIENVEEGTMISAAIAAANVEAPTKDAEEDYTYTFVGWKYEDAEIAGNETIEAEFKKEIIIHDSVKTEIEVDDKKYTEVPNADVVVEDVANKNFNNAKVKVKYIKNGENEYKFQTFGMTGFAPTITGTGNASFNVSIVNVPSYVTITDISVVFGE